ncbi:MAG TPA: glycosyltransferase family 39 protein [Blastocatellia bacterium]|nr:glycosyltransferase family 39 protein [Blastocatellia bacterium]
MQTNGIPLIGKRKNREVVYSVALALLCAFVFFYGLGWAPLIGPDEPRYAEVAREMYVTGDWVTPRLGGIKWFEKPALTYWLSAAGYAIFGENEFAARFGVAALATFGVLLLYFFGRREHSARFGYLSAAALATCGLWPGFARGVTFDLTLTVAIEVAFLSFFLWESKESQLGRNRFWYVFCFAVGLATLAKGLVGIVLPMVVITPYLILTRNWKILLKPRLLGVGALIFLGTVAVWYAPVMAKDGSEFIDEFFIGHHFQRYTSNKYRHPQPFYFFPLVALAGSFPWTFYLISSLMKPSGWRSLKRWRAPSPDPVSSDPASTERTPADRLNLFLGFWIVAPILFFSFSGSKLPGYILPIFPAVALMVGRALDYWWSDDSSPPKVQSYLTAALIAAAGIGSGFVLQRELGVNSRDAWLMGSVAVLAAAVYLGLLFFSSGRTATLYLPIGLAVIVVASAHLVFPGLGNRESLKRLSLMAIGAALPSERLIFFVNHDHGINFYATGLPLRDNRSELVTVTSDDEIALLVEASRSQSLLIISPKRWSDGVMKSEKLRVEKIGAQEFNANCSPECDWVLLRARRNAPAAQP